jgi:chromosome segregation ATPase
MFCVGVAVSRGNARCRWRITGDEHRDVCSILEEMGTKPPKDIYGSKLLSRLAELSLCVEQHQHQHGDILERWNEVIADVAVRYEEMERLRRRIRELEAMLVNERKEREQDQEYLEMSADDERTEFEARESELLLQLKDSEHALAESRGRAERLAARETELSSRLAEERRASAQHQRDHGVIAKQVDQLKLQLSAHRQTSEELRRDLENAAADRRGLLAQTDSLKAQSAVESESLNQVKKSLKEAETAQGTLLKEKENLQSLLATECETSGQLKKKVESLEVELASVQGTLKRTEFDLTQSRKVSAEQAASDAAFRAATTAETARLLEKIRQLEEQSRISFLNAFIERLKGLTEHIALWATGGRWPRKEKRMAVDMG